MEPTANPPPTPSTPSFPPNNDIQQFTTPHPQPTNPALQSKLAQMRLTLAPLVQLTTGEIHPSFPSTLLSFWLLTDPELEELASFYHQRTPCQWTWRYPCPVRWGEGLTIEAKRRKIGRFIGLRGCESPVVARLLDGGDNHNHGQDRAKWEEGRRRGEEERIEEEARRRRGEEERIEEEARRRRLEDGNKWYH